MRLGSDPEVFLQDNNGKLISVIGYINADKWNPRQIEGMAEGFTVQEDNVALEYGIPPAASADEFVAHIKAVMEKSKEFLPGLSFSNLSCAIFPDDQVDHPKAKVFGCEPDFDAWTLKTNMPPHPKHENMRSAGGHIHIETAQAPHEIVRRADLYLGVPSVLMDKGEERKQMYGKAGAHRPKPYGVEYRTLSNFWIFDEKLIRWAWKNMARAVASQIDVLPLQERILEAINNNNKVVAEGLVRDFKLEVI